MRAISHAVACLLLVALGAGCGDDAVVAREPATVDPAPTDPGPVVAHPEKGAGFGMAALIQGSLALTDGCLTVGGYPAMWPHGTTRDAEAQAVVLPDGAVAAVGDTVGGGGGFPYLSDLDPEVAEQFEGCPFNKAEEVAQFNAGEVVEVG